MRHLSLDALARMVDEAPSVEESRHLRDCLVCRRELEELREQTSLLAELPAREPPADAWAPLEERLRAEGLLTGGPGGLPGATRSLRPALRLAASVALFLSGGLAGALLWNRPAPPGVVAFPPLPPAQAPRETGLPAAGDALAGHVGRPAEALAPAQAGGVRLVRSAAAPAARRLGPPAGPRGPAMQRAEAELAQAEAAYLVALSRYAELADPASGADPLTRLEALDGLVELSARALERAPGDARLNGYHLAAVNERDALRRELQVAAQTTWF